MGEHSAISWTDHTFNHVIGCSKVSAGCAHCYAERDFDKWRHFAKWGPHGTRVLTSESNWHSPVQWNRRAADNGRRARVFCASLADVFEDWSGPLVDAHGAEIRRCEYCQRVGINYVCRECMPARTSVMATMQDARGELFKLIEHTPHLDWLLLTKRPENVLRMVPGLWLQEWPAHVWMGTSVENQATADVRIPLLLQMPAGVRFLSCEPLLGPIDLSRWVNPVAQVFGTLKQPPGAISWIIAGGESGPDARPMCPDWARGLRDQCVSAGVAYFFKQWGAPMPDYGLAGNPWHEAGYDVQQRNGGDFLDGRQWHEFPG